MASLEYVMAGWLRSGTLIVVQSGGISPGYLMPLWALCYGFEQQQRSERSSCSRNRTAACEHLRIIECQLCE